MEELGELGDGDGEGESEGEGEGAAPARESRPMSAVA